MLFWSQLSFVLSPLHSPVALTRLPHQFTSPDSLTSFPYQLPSPTSPVALPSTTFLPASSTLLPLPCFLHPVSFSPTAFVGTRCSQNMKCMMMGTRATCIYIYIYT